MSITEATRWRGRAREIILLFPCFSLKHPFHSSSSPRIRVFTILVVDDNVVNLKVAEGALKKYGARVARAESGKKAISMVRPPHDFDACFMDIQMPEMDGFEATKRIRDMEHELNDRIQCGEASIESYRSVSNWHVPILAMTADVIQATQEVCLKCCMDGYVSKPFEGEQLYREVARFFKLLATKSE